MKIYSYQPVSDDYTTYRPELGDDKQAMEHGLISGRIYFSGPDEIPEQHPDLDVKEAELTDELREALKLVSPHAKLIATRMIGKIRARYPLDDELYFARIGVGAATGLYQPTATELEEMTAYGTFVEDVRAWGREQRQALGL